VDLDGDSDVNMDAPFVDDHTKFVSIATTPSSRSTARHGLLGC
jgi:hypothetical protein